jgi:tetratricopeptide (TPR) repeat protein
VSRWLQSILAALVLVSAAVHAEPTNVIDELRTLPAPAERMKQIDAAARAQYDAALADYDKQIEQHPYDIVDRIQRCRFIEQFIGYYEYGGFIDDLYEESKQCRAKVVEEHPEHAEVALWELERTYGDEQLTKGASYLRPSASGTWTAGQSARLYSMLARAADLNEKRELALQYSLKALELDETSDVRLIAATHLIASGDKPRALEILSVPVRGTQPPE